jgi:hypothetical protein
MIGRTARYPRVLELKRSVETKRPKLLLSSGTLARTALSQVAVRFPFNQTPFAHCEGDFFLVHIRTKAHFGS